MKWIFNTDSALIPILLAITGVGLTIYNVVTDLHKLYGAN